MTRALIGLGSNLGDRSAQFDAARVALAALPGTKLVGFSPIYETDPVGPVPQGKFLNAAAEIETALEPRELMSALRGIEAAAGRAPPGATGRVHWGPRPLDLDILLYGDLVIDESGLCVPHPRMHERWFVLRPLADLAPEAEHPILRRSVAALLREIEAREAPGTRG